MTIAKHDTAESSWMMDMGCLRLVGFLKLQVSFAEYRLFYRALLQKRPIIVRSLLILGNDGCGDEAVMIIRLWISCMWWQNTPSSIPSYLFTCLLVYLFTCLLVYLFTCVLAYLLTLVCVCNRVPKPGMICSYGYQTLWISCMWWMDVMNEWMKKDLQTSDNW